MNKKVLVNSAWHRELFTDIICTAASFSSWCNNTYHISLAKDSLDSYMYWQEYWEPFKLL